MNPVEFPLDHERFDAETIMLIGLGPEEIQLVEGLVSGFDIEAEMETVPSIEEAAKRMDRLNVLLVILRVDDGRKRPDQDIRRIRCLLVRSVPLLVLVPQDQSGRVREYIRAGADEYWILPLDSTAFPARLHVLLEWGQSALSEEVGRIEESGTRRIAGSSLVRRMYCSLRHLLTFGDSEPDGGGCKGPSSQEIEH
jgi:DNA-binding NarL/FixJ family response regulator